MVTAVTPAGASLADIAAVIAALGPGLGRAAPGAGSALGADTAQLRTAGVALPSYLLAALSKVDATVAARHYQVVVEAARTGDTPRLLAALEKACLADPAMAGNADPEPLLRDSPAQPQMLLARLGTAARVTAESYLHGATAREVENRPEAVVLLEVARAGIESHRYTDLALAARAAQLALEAPVAKQTGRARSRGRIRGNSGGRLASRIRRVWSRLPLLVLFVTWFLLGLGAGIAGAVFDWAALRAALSVWGAGFLVLVVAGFVASLRRVSRTQSALPAQR